MSIKTKLSKQANILNRAYSKERGVALVVVMLIVAIITVLAVEMSARLQLNVARTINIKSSNQAYWYALGAEQFALKSLNSLSELTGDNINLNQPWAKEFEYPMEGGSIKAKLSDMQSCFNLNTLVTQNNNSNNNANNTNPQQNTNQNTNNAQNTKNQATNTAIQNRTRQTSSVLVVNRPEQVLQTLLEAYIDDSYVVDTIRDSLIDWLDKDDFPLPYGAEDAEYESLPLPYLTANSTLSHLSELRLVKGMGELLKRQKANDLIKVLCVLPQSEMKINVNTITEENALLLSALLGDTSDLGMQIIQNRPEDGFPDKDAFLALPEMKDRQLSQEQLDWFDITTQYFKLDTTATFQGSQFRMLTVFKIEEDSISVVSREFGGTI